MMILPVTVCTACRSGVGGGGGGGVVATHRDSLSAHLAAQAVLVAACAASSADKLS